MGTNAMMKQQAKYFVIISIVLLLVIGFIWINFLYTDNLLEVKSYRQEQVEATYDQLEVASTYLADRLEASYELELKELRRQLIDRNTSMRGTIFDYYFIIAYNKPKNEKRLQEIIDDYNEKNQVKIALYNQEQELFIGDFTTNQEVLSEAGFHEEGELLLYNAEISSLQLQIITYIKYDDYIKSQLINDLQIYFGSEEKVFVLDDSFDTILGNPALITQELGQHHTEDAYYFVTYSPKLNYHIGYMEHDAEIEQAVADRKGLLDRELWRHITEIVASVVLVVLLTIGLYLNTLKRFRKDIEGTAEEIRRSVANDIEIEPERFQNNEIKPFFLIINDLVSRARRDEEKIHQLTISYEQEIKTLKTESLVRRRKLEHCEQQLKDLMASNYKTLYYLYEDQEEGDDEVLSKKLDEIKKKDLYQLGHEKELVNFKDLLEEMASEYRTDHIAIEVHGQDFKQLADVPVIEQIIRILIENSIEHGFAKDSTYNRITMDVFQEDHEVLLYYRDNGIGIPQDFLANVFQKGFTIDPKNHEGLGLTELNDLVLSIGGKLEARSHEGKGVEFVIRLT